MGSSTFRGWFSRYRCVRLVAKQGWSVLHMSSSSPSAMRTLADDLLLARAGPGSILNVYLLGDVVLDSGLRWSRRRLRQQLSGRTISAHVLSHAHFDHAGSSAWLCQTFDVPLWCGAGDAEAIRSGRVDTHQSRAFNRLQQTLLPVQPQPVGRVLAEGDTVGGFDILEVPGHSPGALAFWRPRDRILICGDVLANAGLRPDRPRLVLPPAGLSSNAEENRRSLARLLQLRPRLTCFGHGFAITDPGRFTAAAERLLPN